MNIVNKITLNSLGKNKVRTLVTIIGIILSVSMITAVTTGISSLQNFLANMEIEESGDWYGAAYSISKQKLEEVKNSREISQLTSLQNIGYSFWKIQRTSINLTFYWRNGYCFCTNNAGEFN